MDPTLMSRRTVIYTLALTAAGLVPLGRAVAGPVITDHIGDRVQRVPKGGLPEFVELRNGAVRRLYQYAVDHGDELQYMPCTCGCVRFGHKNNRDCYIKSVQPDGSLTFTSHAAT
jgi:hypothetical protein